ncbi:hypothetical protein BLOT_002931 [Blomia tropicalis]|nr:hypothetical protein BLOT_002931 [Blomia tropicalis]
MFVDLRHRLHRSIEALLLLTFISLSSSSSSSLILLIVKLSLEHNIAILFNPPLISTVESLGDDFVYRLLKAYQELHQ